MTATTLGRVEHLAFAYFLPLSKRVTAVNANRAVSLSEFSTDLIVALLLFAVLGVPAFALDYVAFTMHIQGGAGEVISMILGAVRDLVIVADAILLTTFVVRSAIAFIRTPWHR